MQDDPGVAHTLDDVRDQLIQENVQEIVQENVTSLAERDELFKKDEISRMSNLDQPPSRLR